MAKGKKKEKKDFDAPKRPVTAFFFFQSERRLTLKKEAPNMEIKEMVTKMSEEWKRMNEKDKIKYMKKAEEDRKRYEKEKAAYDAKKNKK